MQVKRTIMYGAVVPSKHNHNKSTKKIANAFRVSPQLCPYILTIIPIKKQLLYVVRHPNPVTTNILVVLCSEVRVIFYF